MVSHTTKSEALSSEDCFFGFWLNMSSKLKSLFTWHLPRCPWLAHSNNSCLSWFSFILYTKPCSSSLLAACARPAIHFSWEILDSLGPPKALLSQHTGGACVHMLRDIKVLNMRCQFHNKQQGTSPDVAFWSKTLNCYWFKELFLALTQCSSSENLICCRY